MVFIKKVIPAKHPMIISKLLRENLSIRFEQEETEFKDDDLVCYCFQYTKKQIEDDFIKYGKSTILEKIALAKKKGKCDCANKNPKGR